mmetsp:Transcript_57475/g.136692  ORF Transcript_57475/g.136692 Transcript_57475/m.136692 type:complete len:1075 (+) Transcript_57475:108-3332(+)
MVDPYLVSQFKKVQARLDELSASQLRIEAALAAGHAHTHHTHTGNPGDQIAFVIPRGKAPPTHSTGSWGQPAAPQVASDEVLSPHPDSPPPVFQHSASRTTAMRTSSGDPGSTAGPDPSSAIRTLRNRAHRGRSCESLESYMSTTRLEPWPEFVWLGDEANRTRLRAKQTRALKSMRQTIESSMNQDLDQSRSLYQSEGEDLMTSGSTRSDDKASASPVYQPWWRRHLVMYPHSKLRLVMDFVGMLTLIYDSVSVPVVIAWERSYTDAVRALAWATACFWTFDMITNFFTAQYTERTSDLRLRSVSLHYLRSWFCLDFSVVLCEWISLILEIVSESDQRGTLLLKFARLLKIGRILRFLAVLRVGRFAQGSEYLLVIASQVLQPVYIEYGIRLTKLLLLIMWFNHVGACLWHFVGMSEFLTDWHAEEQDTSWTPPSADIYLYSFGYYWSAAAMFSGATITFPETTFQNVYSAVIVIFGVIFASSLTSTLAALLIESQISERENTSRMRTLRLFLQQHSVSVPLSVAIQRQVMARMQAERRLSDQDVPALHLISADMRANLRHSLCEPLLMTNDIFRALYDVDAKFMEDLLVSPAITIHSNVPGEEVFDTGVTMNGARVVVFGQLRYTAKERDALWNTRASVVRNHKWICEVALWCQWTSKGLLEVTSPSELLELNTIELGKIARKSAFVAGLFRDIGVQFCLAILQEQPDNVGDLVTGVHMDTVLFALPSKSDGQGGLDSRSILSYRALASLRRWHPLLRPSSLGRVEQEVDEGTCMLRSDGGGFTMKVRQVAILHLKREDETTCVRLNIKGGSRHSVCLPSTKVRAGELPRQAIDRLIKKDMPDLAGRVLHKGSVSTVSDKHTMSWTHKVRVRCITVDCFAKLLPKVSRSDESPSSVLEPDAVDAMLETRRGRRSYRAQGTHPLTVEMRSQTSFASSWVSETVFASMNKEYAHEKGKYGWISMALLEASSRDSLRHGAGSWTSIPDGMKEAIEEDTVSGVGQMAIEELRSDPISDSDIQSPKDRMRPGESMTSQRTYAPSPKHTATNYLPTTPQSGTGNTTAVMEVVPGLTSC